MRRRNLFTLAAGASAMLCIAVCVLWVRSNLVADRLRKQTDSYRIDVYSSRGAISVYDWHGPFPETHPWIHGSEPADLGSPRASVGFGEPMEMQYKETVWRGSVSGVALPPWVLVGAFGIAPLIALIRMNQRRRERSMVARGRCPSCGYDLRATPDRCPECGAAAKG